MNNTLKILNLSPTLRLASTFLLRLVKIFGHYPERLVEKEVTVDRVIFIVK